MSDGASPLARKTLAALRKLLAGNGVKPDRLTLIKEESGEFALHGILALTLDTARTVRQEPGRPGGVHVFGSKPEMEAEITRACGELIRSPQAMAVVDKVLLNAPGGGFGSHNKIIPVKGLHFDFATLATCTTCQGKGKGGCPVCQGQGRTPCPQCRGQREEWCGHCRGTGFQDGDQSKPRCTYCQGVGRMRCLRCNAQGFIPCQPCGGTGHSHCKTCRGAGELADVVGLDFTWKSRFIPHTGEIPRAVSHLMGQGTLEVMAAKGHIVPRRVGGPLPAPPQIDPDQPAHPAEPATHYWHYMAEIPWCEATLKLGQSALLVTAAGQKGRINTCPAFLDKIAPKAPRLQNEALGAVLRHGMNKRAALDMKRLYPVGLSDRVLQDVLKNASRTIHQRTLVFKIGAWMGALVACGALGWFLRGLPGPIAGFVVGMMVFHGIKLFGQARFAAEAKVPYKPNLNIGWETLALLALAALTATRHLASVG